MGQGQGVVVQMSDRRKPTPVPSAQLLPVLLELLAEQAGTRGDLARRTNRPPSDKTVKARLDQLLADGRVVQVGDEYALAPDGESVPPPAVPDWLEGYEFPAHFDAISCELFVLKLDEHDVETTTELELLESYVGALQQARHANEAVAKAGSFSTAKTGRVYAHPGIAVAQAAEIAAARFRADLEKLDERKAGGDDDAQGSLFDDL